MRVDQVADTIHLTAPQRSVVDRRDPVFVVSGPPASGKTTALAGRAMAVRAAGSMPVVICSHESGCDAFRHALASLGETDADMFGSVATLPEHATRWLRQGYASASCAPALTVGGRGATREIVGRAARGLLDMTWPLFARADLDLDLPHLSKPETFLDEAAELFGLLHRARVSPAEFEEGCAAGLAAFYGQGIERAQMLIADPLVHKRASSRGRASLNASAETLTAQRAAELGLVGVLVQLYCDYRKAAASAEVRAPEDVIDSLVAWLAADATARGALCSSIGEIIVDDAEDAEPALGAVLRALNQEGRISLVLAGYNGSRVDGFEGRRSALEAFATAARVELPPLGAKAAVTVERLAGEREEATWIAERIAALLRNGAAAETIAVLTRSTDAAVVYATALHELGLPVTKPSAVLEREDEIADLLALCAVVDDPADQEHLLRVLSSPLVGLCDANLWALCQDPAEAMQLSLEIGAQAKTTVGQPQAGVLARNVATGAADGVLPQTTRDRIVAFREQLARWRSGSLGLSATARFIYIAAAAGFRAHWEQAQGFERQRLHEDCARVAQAVELASQAGARDFGEIGRLIEDEVVPLAPVTHHVGAIVADTIVAQKGRRFDHVFVAGVAHERFPRIYTSHAMAFSRTYGLIVRENVAAGAPHTAKFAWYYAKFGAKGMYLDEERRALSYGLSRATSTAYVSGYGSPPHWARDHDLLATVATNAPS